MTAITPIRADATRASITLAHADLKAALAIMSRVVEKKSKIPILTHVRIRVEGADIFIVGTDLDIEIVHRMRAVEMAADSRFDICAPLHRLADVIRGAKGAGEITLTMPIGGKEDRLEVSAAGAAITLNCLPASDFPEMAQPKATHRFDITASTLASSLDLVAHAISSEETRYYLNGVYMHRPLESRGQGGLTFVATDGHRLAKKVVDAPAGSGGMPGVIVPRKTVALLQHLAAGNTARIAVTLSSGGVSFGHGETVVRSKVIDGRFPDYSRVFPATNDKAATFSCDVLKAAIAHVAAISSERARTVLMSFSPGRCRLSVTSPDSGTAESTIVCDTDIDAFEIGFNARYLDAMTDAAEDLGDTITFAMSDPGSPALVCGLSPSWSGVQMPMRI